MPVRFVRSTAYIAEDVSLWAEPACHSLTKTPMMTSVAVAALLLMCGETTELLPPGPAAAMKVWLMRAALAVRLLGTVATPESGAAEFLPARPHTTRQVASPECTPLPAYWTWAPLLFKSTVPAALAPWLAHNTSTKTPATPATPATQLQLLYRLITQRHDSPLRLPLATHIACFTAVGNRSL